LPGREASLRAQGPASSSVICATAPTSSLGLVGQYHRAYTKRRIRWHALRRNVPSCNASASSGSTSGWRSTTRSRALAAPVGCRRPCKRFAATRSAQAGSNHCGLPARSAPIRGPGHTRFGLTLLNPAARKGNKGQTLKSYDLRPIDIRTARSSRSSRTVGCESKRGSDRLTRPH
jgi:hypothetical protein